MRTPLLRSTRTTRALAVGAALLLGAFTVACSSSSGSSGSRDAAGLGAASSANSCDPNGATPVTTAPSTPTTVVDPSGSPCEKVNVGEFCKNPKFGWVRDITICFQLINRTQKFSAPDTLGARFELTIPEALCGPTNPPTPCRENTGFRGIPRDETLGSTYGRRTLRPNPFADAGYIQFQPDSIWQGVKARLFVGSQQAPMSLDDALAQPEFENPSSGTNGGNCDTQGAYFACSIDQSSWSRDGTVQNPKFVFSTHPMRVRVANSIGSSTVVLKRMSSSAGSGLRLDPVAEFGLDTIAKGQVGLTGGYRLTSGTGAKTWTASYCVVEGASATAASASTCTVVDISVAYSIDKDGKLVNDSTCTVTNRSAAKTYICDKPALTGGEEDLIATINVRDF